MAEAKLSSGSGRAARPLSPHLGAYRLTLTMAMSIVHRITGAALYVGTLLLVWWLVALSTDAGAFKQVSRFLGSFVGQLILFGYTWALFHHMLGGIRHFIWDTGRGFGAYEREWLTIASLVGSIGLTIVIWVL